MKILLTEKSAIVYQNDLSLDIFNKFGEVKVYDNISRAELLAEARDTEVILCNKAVIDREVLSVAKKLRYVGTFATGYNNVDTVFAREMGVTVCNAAGYSTNAVVQQVICYILMHYTKVPEYSEFVKRDGWINSHVFSPLVFTTEEVFGKTLGIVGYGSIGKAVAKAAKGLGMMVKVFTRTAVEDGETEFVTFDELLAGSDIVSLHCPLNKESENLMNGDAFANMKNGAFFINTSRGGTVDEKALAQALKSGKLSGAAVDVLKQEPMKTECPLKDAPNLIITPHSSWGPLDTRKRLVNLVAENLSAFLSGNPQNVVN